MKRRRQQKTSIIPKRPTYTCPCCGEERTVYQCKQLMHWRQHRHKDLGNSPIYQHRLLEEQTFWACDICLKKGRAVLADPSKQYFEGYSSPQLVYIDQPKTCEKCQKDFVYTKEAQQFWYEKLGKYRDSKATRCRACRLPGQYQRRINAIHQQLKLNDPDALIELIQLYVKLEKLEKAKYYLAQLRKLDKQYQSLEQIPSK